MPEQHVGEHVSHASLDAAMLVLPFVDDQYKQKIQKNERRCKHLIGTPICLSVQEFEHHIFEVDNVDAADLLALGAAGGGGSRLAAAVPAAPASVAFRFQVPRIPQQAAPACRRTSAAGKLPGGQKWWIEV